MGCRRMMVGGVLLCAVASAFLLAQSAPTKSSSKASSKELTSHEKPLVRTKRAEDIMYGNPQSSARVKKSDPSAVATPDDEATKTDANALPPEENDRKDDAEQSLPEEKQSDEQEEYGGASNEQNNLEEMPIEAVEGVSDGDGEGDSEHPETARRRRSAEAEALMTAENMASSAARRTPLRAKRDLDYEELRQLLENSRQAEEEQEEEQEGDDDDIGLPVDVASVLQETNSEGEEEEEEEDDREDGAVSLVMPYPYAPRVSSEKEELIRELVAEREKEEAKEKVIDYLLAAALTDAESTADDDGGGRFLVEAPVPLDDIGPVAAVKRSALYPYSHEPPHGSRWAAPVSGPKRSRLGEYERLNRLAEALGVYNDYEETEEEEK